MKLFVVRLSKGRDLLGRKLEDRKLVVVAESKEHAAQIGVKSSNWHLMTGDKDYIYSISNKGFNIYAGENGKAAGGFEHSGLFALIDKKGNIRCRKDEHGNPIMYYDGLEKAGVKAIIEDIKKLLNE